MVADDGRRVFQKEIRQSNEKLNKSFLICHNDGFMQSTLREMTNCLMFVEPTAILLISLSALYFESAPHGFQIWSRDDCMQILDPIICISRNGALVIFFLVFRQTCCSTTILRFVIHKSRLDIPTKKVWSLLSRSSWTNTQNLAHRPEHDAIMWWQSKFINKLQWNYGEIE